jgi:predicted RNase H-like nuclease (RuvC/YqgF family)
MKELSFDVVTPVKLYPGSKNLQHLIKCIVDGMSLQNAIMSMMKKILPDIDNLSIKNIENEQEINKWLQPFVAEEKLILREKLLNQIKNLEGLSKSVLDDLQELKDELKKINE